MAAPDGSQDEDPRETSANHWDRFYRCWSRLRAPLRPDPDIVAAFKSVLGEPHGRTLLLGVTPELAFGDRDLVAVDRSQDMIDHLWPGDTPRRSVIHGQWDSFAFPDNSFQAALGDGSLNVLAYPDGHAGLYAEVGRLLTPGSLFALRVYATPDGCETLDELASAVRRRDAGSFHAFKFRLAMALTAKQGDANLVVTQILDAFETMFPDRAELAAVTGWPMADIETIDIYRGSAAVYSFPTLSGFHAAIPDTFALQGHVDSGSYDIADRCPLMVLVRR
jgi:SAM-dependent methyltransferase